MTKYDVSAPEHLGQVRLQGPSGLVAVGQETLRVELSPDEAERLVSQGCDVSEVKAKSKKSSKPKKSTAEDAATDSEE